MKLNFNTNQDDPAMANHAHAYFGYLSAVTPSILPLSRGRTASFVLDVYGMMPGDDLPVSRASITKLEDGMATVGGYLTDPAFRGHGYGSQTLGHLLELAPQLLEGIMGFEAFVNPQGISQFEALGFEVVGMREPPAGTGCNFVVQKLVALETIPILSEQLRPDQKVVLY